LFLLRKLVIRLGLLNLVRSTRDSKPERSARN
jgi:hypothetical protein